MKNIVGRRVQEARKNLSLSQEELIIQLELSGWKLGRVGLAKIEGGVRQVTDIEVMILSKVLKVPLDWLMDQNSFENLMKEK